MLSIIKDEGVGGVYKGAGKKLLQSVLTAAVLFVGQKKIYEAIKKVSIPSRRVFVRVLSRPCSKPDVNSGFPEENQESCLK